MTLNTVAFKFSKIQRSARMFRTEHAALRPGLFLPLRPMMDDAAIDGTLFPSATKTFVEKGILQKAQDSNSRYFLNTGNLTTFIVSQNGARKMCDQGLCSRSETHALNAVVGRLTGRLVSLYGDAHNDAIVALRFLRMGDYEGWNYIKEAKLDPRSVRMDLNGLAIGLSELIPPKFKTLSFCAGITLSIFLPSILLHGGSAVVLRGILIFSTMEFFFYPQLRYNKMLRDLPAQECRNIDLRNIIVNKDTFLAIPRTPLLSEEADNSKINAAILRGRWLRVFSTFYPDVKEADLLSRYFL
ncbi:MAG: hypothetical protein WCY10_05710 [Candidatus Omnitrophota bacterium]